MVEWSSTEEKLNDRRPYILVEWSFSKERANERGPYMLVKWSCANKINKSINKSMMTIILGQMIGCKRKNKWKRTIYFVFLLLVLLKEVRTRCESKVSSFSFWCWSKELGGRMSPKFPCLTAVVESFSSDLLWVITNYWAVSYLKSCQTSVMKLFYENNQRP